jgi:hypothetical protein
VVGGGQCARGPMGRQWLGGPVGGWQSGRFVGWQPGGAARGSLAGL